MVLGQVIESVKIDLGGGGRGVRGGFCPMSSSVRGTAALVHSVLYVIKTLVHLWCLKLDRFMTETAAISSFLQGKTNSEQTSSTNKF